LEEIEARLGRASLRHFCPEKPRFLGSVATRLPPDAYFIVSGHASLSTPDCEHEAKLAASQGDLLAVQLGEPPDASCGSHRQHEPV
jgi:hypothetical protein